MADKVSKNQMIAGKFLEQYGGVDYCAHRVDASAGLLLTPRPAGVVLAITPATSPVAAVYFKVLCALLTRNAVVVSPHPSLAGTCADATRLLASAAAAAGAPADIVQVIERPTIPLVEALMADECTNLILATGGGAVVRAAYSSGNPAIGVGPGNPPVIVDETADLRNAAECIVESKRFDSSVLCTAESVLYAVDSIAAPLLDKLREAGAHICTSREALRIREFVYPGGNLNTKAVGRSAVSLAADAGITVSPRTKLLVASIERTVSEEPLTHEKLCPLLAFEEVPDFATALREARALVDIVGLGHSAVIHTAKPQRVLDLSVGMPVHRITVNAPGSLGNAGFGTGLPMTMSVGTGFVGGSSSGDNLSPEHLVQWCRTAYADSAVFPDFTSMRPSLPTPVSHSASLGPIEQRDSSDAVGAIREELRRLVLEELHNLIGTR